ncbi:PP2C family protein-serine/threonine phosphatase [Streptomyces sp. NPDC087658]|uniref:PP2C family protein-serine/threonine phosphatase n=1 Tax=Streptomyces sp. NPDC087658 TaxID=3365800 RepID=UPI0038267794
MSAPRTPKVAGINSVSPVPAHAPASLDDSSAPYDASAAPAAPAELATSAALDAPATSDPSDPSVSPAAARPPGALLQDRLAGWVSELAALHTFVERLSKIGHLDDALPELLHTGAALVGARRGFVVFEPADRLGGPVTTLGLGLSHAELGLLETVPRHATSYGRLLLGGASGDGSGGDSGGGGSERFRTETLSRTETFTSAETDPRQREVAERLGYGACYAVPLATPAGGALGVIVWLYDLCDESAEPVERQRRLVRLHIRYAAEHLARLLDLERARTRANALTEELLPRRLPRVPGVRLAARHRSGPCGGGHWYDALPLPEGALSLAVGSVSGGGPGAVASAGRLRASLRAYAVMEGEDPVAVLSDLELLLRLTEPARTATALFAYVEPDRRGIVLAGAGHAPPLIVGERRTAFVETSLSAPLGVLSCWQAPSVVLSPARGETVLLYTDGLLRRTDEPMDRAFARLLAAASSVPTAARDDPEAVADHVLRTLLPSVAETESAAETETGGTETGAETETAAGPPGAGTRSDDFVLLAVRFG